MKYRSMNLKRFALMENLIEKVNALGIVSFLFQIGDYEV